MKRNHPVQFRTWDLVVFLYLHSFSAMLNSVFDVAIKQIVNMQNLNPFDTQERMHLALDSRPDFDLVPDVAQWYRERPEHRHTERAGDFYATFRRECVMQYDQLVPPLDVVLSSMAEPYDTAQSMKDVVTEYGKIHIRSTREFNDTPEGHPLDVLAKRENGSYIRDRFGSALTYNDVFRVVHDVLTHCIGGSETSFDLVGEYRATLMHSALFSYNAEPALWNEAFAQVCYFDSHGHFPPQKVNQFPRHLINEFKPVS